jgi:hypothetical protein
MPNLKKPRQIKFYCTEEKFELFQSIKIRRRASTQELMTEALDSFIDGDLRDQYYEDDIRKVTGDPAYRAWHPPVQAVWAETGDQAHWVTMWKECLVELPAETSGALKKLMESLLRFFRSSKLRAAPQRGRKKPDGEQEEASQR